MSPLTQTEVIPGGNKPTSSWRYFGILMGIYLGLCVVSHFIPKTELFFFLPICVVPAFLIIGSILFVAGNRVLGKAMLLAAPAMFLVGFGNCILHIQMFGLH